MKEVLDNLHIENSYKISKFKFIKIIKEYKKENPDRLVFKRNIYSLITEWSFHNLLYFFHIKRKQTKDVDLDYPQEWYMTILYYILGTISFIFIK